MYELTEGVSSISILDPPTCVQLPRVPWGCSSAAPVIIKLHFPAVIPFSGLAAHASHASLKETASIRVSGLIPSKDVQSRRPYLSVQPPLAMISDSDDFI